MDASANTTTKTTLTAPHLLPGGIALMMLGLALRLFTDLAGRYVTPAAILATLLWLAGLLAMLFCVSRAAKTLGDAARDLPMLCVVLGIDAVLMVVSWVTSAPLLEAFTPSMATVGLLTGLVAAYELARVSPTDETARLRRQASLGIYTMLVVGIVFVTAIVLLSD